MKTGPDQPENARDVIDLAAGDAVGADRFGRRAAKLARLTALGLPVPPGVALSFDCVRRFADTGRLPEIALPNAPLALRSSPQSRSWAGPPATLGLTGSAGGPEGLDAAALAMVRAWNAPTARILREAKGAPRDAGLGLIVQSLAPASGGTGEIQLVAERSGAPAMEGGVYAEGGRRGLSDLPLDILAALRQAVETASVGLGDAFRLRFVLSATDGISVIDAVPARRNARAAVRIAVDLAESGVIDRREALLRVEPRGLIEHLHPQVDPSAARDVFGAGLAASPGAATGRLVFTSLEAQGAAAQGEAVILARPETSPEDIRGMHAASGVLTLRGGMSSHAAVIARGIGLPCIVGAGDLRLDAARRSLTAPDGRVLVAGDILTLDGTRGEVLVGGPATVPPEMGGALARLLDWADAERDMAVRANADTPGEAEAAKRFGADGLGLCRTEHMFFDPARIPVMQEMILARSPEERRAALDRLLPMQRADFRELFAIMRGMPVTIRLLDPPLHEFLPKSTEGLTALAEGIGRDPGEVMEQASALAETNPMLGRRGVRLGISVPEIYDMQARAIFEAAIDVNLDATDPVVPEIMIPLVSANREVEIARARIDAVATAVMTERGARLTYSIGVMVETPRAALRAGDIAVSCGFMSFGTNDLTQMTYGLSRDDAGQFMRDYVRLGVFTEDPFRTLDVEGVGELLVMAANRARSRNPDVILGLCGEHGGDPGAIRFCRVAGFDHVSCSPFRVPIARLAAAQAAILSAGSRSSAGPSQDA